MDSLRCLMRLSDSGKLTKRMGESANAIAGHVRYPPRLVALVGNIHLLLLPMHFPACTIQATYVAEILCFAGLLRASAPVIQTGGRIVTCNRCR
jgi:hypothetical protein